MQTNEQELKNLLKGLFLILTNPRTTDAQKVEGCTQILKEYEYMWKMEKK